MATAKNKAKLQPYWYTLESEREDDNATKWFIKPLTPAQKEQLTTSDEFGHLGFHMKSYDKALAFALKDWNNLNNEDGDPVKYSIANMELIDDVDRTYLALEIYTSASLKAEEIKNS